MAPSTSPDPVPHAEATRAFARIGLLSFGGPAAQIAVMHRILVDEKRWLTEPQFLHALNFCMLLPGPEAMQLATYAGWRLHGVRGGLIAGLLFSANSSRPVLAQQSSFNFEDSGQRLGNGPTWVVELADIDGDGDVSVVEQQKADRKAAKKENRGKNGNNKLGGAGEAMKQAEGELGDGGDRDKAVDAQGRALEALRNGADQLAQDMRNRGNSSEQAGDDEGPAMGEAGGQERDEADPLGRPRDRRRRFDPNARYDPLGATPALRAQRVLEELRRRLGETARPQDELDYLERLIRR